MKKLKPQPVVKSKLTQSEINGLLGIVPVSFENSIKVIRDIVEGSTIEQAARKNGLNFITVMSLAKTDEVFKDALSKAKKFRAVNLQEGVYKETVNQLTSLKKLSIDDRRKAFAGLFKYISRLTSLHDEEQNPNKVIEDIRAKQRIKDKKEDDKEKPLIIQNFLGDVGKDYDLEAKRVDSIDKDPKEQYVSITEE